MILVGLFQLRVFYDSILGYYMDENISSFPGFIANDYSSYASLSVGFILLVELSFLVCVRRHMSLSG